MLSASVITRLASQKAHLGIALSLVWIHTSRHAISSRFCSEAAQLSAAVLCEAGGDAPLRLNELGVH